MANYPGSISSYTTKLAGDTIQAAHVNDLQSEVTALETGLLNGTEHLLWPNVSDTYDLGKTATRWRNLYLSGLLDSSKVGAHLISGAGTGQQSLTIRNSAAGTGNYASLLLTTDVSPEGLLRAHSSTFTTAAPYAASGVTLESQGSGGLSLAATHASGTVKFYVASTTLEAEIDATTLRKYGTAGEARLQVDNTANYTECHIRAASGKKGYLSLTEDSVADRWGLGIENGDSALYLRQGAVSSSTVVMKANSTGSVNWPLQPRCLCIKAGDQTITDGAGFTSVTFDGVDVYDVGALHDPGTNSQRITIVEDGIYEFGAIVVWAAEAAGNRSARILKNAGGTVLAFSDAQAPGAYALAQTVVTPPVSLVATDYVQVSVALTDAGANVNVVGGATYTQFWCKRIS